MKQKIENGNRDRRLVYHRSNRATYFEDSSLPGMLNVVYRGRGASNAIMKLRNDAGGRNILKALKTLNPTIRYRVKYRCPETGQYAPHCGAVRMFRAKVMDVRVDKRTMGKTWKTIL